MDKVFDANFATVLLIKDRKVLLCRDVSESSPGFLISMVEDDATAAATAAKSLRENLSIEFADTALTPLATVHADAFQGRAYILENDLFTLTEWSGELTPINPTTGVAEIRWASVIDLESGIADNVFNGLVISELKQQNLID
jgi:hypothetical protein